MKTIQGDLLDIERGILVHQVNLLGIMGGGIAFQIANKWPALHRAYKELFRTGSLELGGVFFFSINPGLIVANLAGQESIGGIATRYEAYDKALPEINAMAESVGLPVYFPKNIGCGLAGGDWSIMEPILEKYCPEATLVEFNPAAIAA